MPPIAYKVVREDGTSANDESLAADAGDFRRDLKGSGYIVLNIAEKKAGLRGGRGNTKDFIIFNQAGRLPLLTTLLISFTATLASYAPLILATEIATGIGIYLWQKTDTGKQVLDTIKLRIPLVRTPLIQYTLSHHTWTLATVLGVGFPLAQSLDTTAGMIHTHPARPEHDCTDG